MCICRMEAEHMRHFKSDFEDNPNVDFATPIEVRALNP